MGGGKKDDGRLAPIFHGNSSRGAAQPDVEKEDDGLRRRLYVSAAREAILD